MQNSSSGNGNPNFNSMNALNTGQFANITNSLTCNTSNAISSITVENYSINIPYGQIAQNGRYVDAGNMLHYAAYNGSTLSLYNITITKAVPNLEIKIGGLTLNSSDPNTTVLISPYVRSGDVIHMTDNYTLNTSLLSAVAGNNPLNYSYRVYIGGTLKENGNISTTSIGKSISFANIPSGETSRIVFDASGNSNYTSVDPTVYYTTANTNEVISSNTILGSDLVCGSLTIDSGKYLTTNGWNILCSNTVINNGEILTGYSSSGGTTAGASGSSYSSSYGGSGGGGGGGGGNGGPGHNGGTPTLPSITTAQIQTWYNGGFYNYASGAGGGAGGASSSDIGGNSAWGLYIQANSITAGTIIASGGSGSGSSTTGTGSGGAGGSTVTGGGAGGSGTGKAESSGGGGGGGAFVLLAYNGVGTAPSTAGISVTGGAGATGVTQTGGNGGNGQTYVFNYGTTPPITVLPPTVTLSTCPSTSAVESGSTVSCTATADGGTGPFSYNWIVSNSITGAIVANMLFTGVASTTNTFTYTTTSADVSNSPEQFNVIITQSGGSTLVSQYSSTFIIAKGLSTPTISPSNPTIDSGQSITFSSTWSGGIPTYGASLYSSSTSTCNQQSTLIQQDIGLTSGSETFSPVSPTSNTYYCTFVTDNSEYSPYLSNSIISGFNYPDGVSFSPSGTYAYADNAGADNVVIINTATNTVVNSIIAGFNGPPGVAISPSGTYAYVTNSGSSNVVIINTATNTVVNSIIAGFNDPQEVSISPSGTYAYVANAKSNNVVIINTATNTVVNSITSGFSQPIGVAISPSGTYAYVTNYNSQNVVIINTATYTIVNSITSGFNYPGGVSFSPSGTYAYVTNYEGGSALKGNIIIINTATNTIVNSITSGINSPQGVAISPSGTYAYVTNCNSSCSGSGPDNVIIINTETSTTNSMFATMALVMLLDMIQL